MPASDASFETLAGETLERLTDAIDEAAGDQLDVELTGGVLTIDLDAGGQYVINKHAASRQIWMSSPKSGASHFDHRPDGGWVATNGTGTLQQILSGELSAITGTSVALD